MREVDFMEGGVYKVEAVFDTGSAVGFLSKKIVEDLALGMMN